MNPQPVIRALSARRPRRLVTALGVLLVAATVGSTVALGPTAPVTAAAVGDCTPGADWGTLRQDFSDQVVVLVNQHRASLGLSPLAVSPRLTASAVWKARHMAYLRYMAHNDPAPPVARTTWERLQACGYGYSWGENIAQWYGSPQAVMQGWLNSPGHRAAIESPAYRAIGVGTASSSTGLLYWAQNFGTVVDSGSAPTATATPKTTATPTPTATPSATPIPTTSPTATPTPPSSLTAYPSSITIFAGTPVSGGVMELRAQDGASFSLNATPATSWYGRIVGIPNTLKTLTVSYRGSHSASCTQELWVWNWTGGAWLKLDSRTGGPAAQDVVLPVSGAVADYVSGTAGNGEVAVAVTCRQPSGGNVTTSSDFLQVRYTP